MTNGPARTILGCCVFFIFVLFALTGAEAQDINRAVVFEELGFALPLHVGARAAALAGTYTTLGDDVHSLVYNPAGLARIKRIELSVGIHQEYKETRNEFFGTATEISGRNGGIESLGIAYPFPTYRGSMVASFGIYRIYSSFLDIEFSGKNLETETIDNYLFQQSGSVYSYNLGLGVDLSPVLSGGFGIFLINGSVNSLTQYDYSELHTIPRRSVFVMNDVNVEMTGFGARAGVQFFLHPSITGGLSFTTPTFVSTTGDSVKETTKYVDNSGDLFEESSQTARDDYLIPYRFDLGIAYTSELILAAFEIAYTDWHGTAVNKKRFRDHRTSEPVFDATIEYRVGTELSVPRLPVDIRAGYAYRPYPFKYLQIERIDDRAKYERGYESSRDRVVEAEVSEELKQFTLGAGMVLGSVITCDAAYIYQIGERSTTSLTDERLSSRFVLGVSYKF